jgi:predicted CopG family antitoxin
MASKNISIREEVYKKLLKIKQDNESFSDLLLRLLKNQKTSLEKSFGAWDLSEDEKKEIWSDLTDRSGRQWNKPSLEDLR